jgi:hypothetical protein
VFISAYASRPADQIIPRREINFAQASVPAAQPAVPQAGDFLIECADCPREFDDSSDRMLRLDSLGDPHLAYGRDHLYYTWRDENGWHSEMADSAILVGTKASLALTQAGSPRISYFDALHGALKFAFRDASGWHSQILDSAASGSTSLAVDASGYAHISYWDGRHLKYAYQDAGGWNFELADSNLFTGQSSSLALDKDGMPHISYWDQTHASLNYAYKDAGGWHLLQVDAASASNEYTSIALDGKGQAHISYWDGYPNYDLKYAIVNASIITTTLVDTVDNVGAYNSIVLDSTGHPHISYQADDALRYASLEAGVWQTDTIASGGLTGGFTSIDLDINDKPRIGYYDLTVGNFGYEIIYIHQSGTNWISQVIDTGSNVGADTSLALDEQGYPHISYMDNTLIDLKYAYQDANGWHQQTLDWAYSVGLCTSLALDKHGYPHISYYDLTHSQLKYIYQDLSGWQPAVVLDSGAATGCNSSLAVDSLGYAHISYYLSTPKALRYAYQDASGWHYTSLETVGNTAVDSSLALDSNDAPHISYFYVASEDLRYASLQGTDWVTATVDMTGSVGSYNALALDGNGNAYIAYRDDSHQALKFATQTGGGWQIETVDASGNTGSNPAIAVDSSGAAHISYTGDLCPGPCGRLKYAENSGGAWITQTLTLEGDYNGLDSSIALDSYDGPRISFYDPSTGDLKYAHPLIPVQSLEISGARSGALGATYPFTATILPPAASLPITTTWQASHQATVVQVGGSLQTITYTWSVPGVQVITVTAQSPASLVTATHTITISETPIAGLTATNDSPTVFGASTVFSASVQSGSNVSYAWQFGDGESGIGQEVEHTYASPGAYTATVTASNSAGQVQATTQVQVVYPMYLPLVPDE